MVLFLIFFLGMAFVFCYKKTVYGCCFLLMSRILIPECVRLTPFVDISLNTAVIVIITLFVCRDLILEKIHVIEIGHNKYFQYIFIYTISFIIILFLSNYVQFSFQWAKLQQFVITDFLSTLLFLILIRTKTDLILMLKALFIISFISCVWGCITFLIGENPYVFYINKLYSSKEYLFEVNTLGNSRGISATSGTFEHANGWGYYLPITFSFFFFLYNITKRKILIILLILLSICVVICSKRSALLAYASFWVFYFILINGKNKFKFIGWAIVSFFIIYLFVSVFPEFEKAKGLIESSLFFWDDKLADKNNISGSNFEMRVNQFTYSFVEVKDNILFGKGYGWSALYLSNHAFHPILYGFETIISDAVVNGGISGLCLWLYIFFSSYRYSVNNDKDKKFYKIFTAVQIVIALATGLSYFIFYGIYIVLLNKFYLIKNNENISCYRNV